MHCGGAFLQNSLIYQLDAGILRGKQRQTVAIVRAGERARYCSPQPDTRFPGCVMQLAMQHDCEASDKAWLDRTARELYPESEYALGKEEFKKRHPIAPAVDGQDRS